MTLKPVADRREGEGVGPSECGMLWPASTNIFYFLQKQPLFAETAASATFRK
jgi:hypothetical protein